MSPSTAVRMEEANDTEITLGTGKMLALFFGLVILCAVFFGMGFSMGKNSVRSTPELLPSPSQSNPRSAASKPTGTASSGSTSQPAQAPAAQTSSTNNSSAPEAIIANQPSDKLFHVQVGPFTDIKEAEGVRSKLVSDGYNPILKK